jgi:Protein of unknown function (DUF3592)
MVQSLRTLYFPIFIVVALMTIFGPAQPLWRLWQISADPVSTQGHIVRLDCHNHGHVEYSFDAEGVSRNGRNPFVDGINCPDAKVGQAVAVYYEKSAPENNYALYPAGTSGNRARTALITGVAFFGAFILIGPLFLAWLWRLFSRLTGSR